MPIVILLLLLVMLVPSIAGAASNSMIWDPNTETDLAGYKVYRFTPCGDALTGAPSVPLSSLAVLGTVNTYTDTTAPDGVDVEYRVTAYDTSGNESPFSNQYCKKFQLVYHKTVTDKDNVLWGLVGAGPSYRVYKNGADLLPGNAQNNATDVRLVDGVAQFKGTDGDNTWYIYTTANGWKPADQTPPAAPINLRAQ
jgi:hypothetical protein